MTETVRVRMLVAYDGTDFRGFAVNEGVRTVAGELQVRLSALCGVPVTLTCAGRTDAGVHGWGQVVSFDAPTDRFDPKRWTASLNKQSGGVVVVRDIAQAAPDFDARFSAKWRRYRYTVLNRPIPDPFRRHTSWWMPAPLDIDAMNDAATRIVGEHDFASFCRRPERADGTPASLVRRILDATWSAVEGEAADGSGDVGGNDPRNGIVRLEITATAFCHQMVRSLVGCMVDVGRGRRTPDDMARTLVAKDRATASQPAPSVGLCLWEVGYD